jgi:hypothetical protein
MGQNAQVQSRDQLVVTEHRGVEALGLNQLPHVAANVHSSHDGRWAVMRNGLREFLH